MEYVFWLFFVSTLIDSLDTFLFALPDCHAASFLLCKDADGLTIYKGHNRRSNTKILRYLVKASKGRWID